MPFFRGPIATQIRTNLGLDPNVGFFERLFGQNQLPTGETDKPENAGIREQQTAVSNLDEDLALNLRSLEDTILGREQRNKASQAEALKFLGELSGDITGFFGGLESDIKSDLPLNPFSDALEAQILADVQDEITKRTQAEERARNVSLSSRGLQGGGSTGVGLANDLLMTELGLRSGATAQAAESQLDFNTKANQFRDALLSDLVKAKTTTLGRVGSLEAAIRSGDVVDPTLLAGVREGVFSAQMQRDLRDEILSVIEKQGMNDKLSNLIQSFLGIPLTLTFPRGEAVQGALGLADPIIRDIFVPGVTGSNA